MRLFFLLPIAGIVLSATTQAKEKPTLTWVKWNDPPIFIFDGKYKGTGLLDLIQKDIESLLPEYKHVTINANVLRVIELAKNSSNTCNAGWLNTPEWSSIFYFSNPSVIIPSNGVIMKKDIFNKISGEKSYPSPTPPASYFFDNKSLTSSLGRRYGEGIDDYLDKINYEKREDIIKSNNSLIAFKMLLRDRVDFTIGYPFEIKFYEMTINKEKGSLVHIPVSDNSPTVPVVFACSKNDFGREVINKINKQITRKKLADFDSYLRSWLYEEYF